MVIAGLIISVVIVLILLYSIFIEPHNLEVNEFSLRTSRLAEEESFTILHLSDLHLREFGRREQRLVDYLDGVTPDVIIITGDFIEDFSALYKFEKIFRSMKSKFGVFGVLGNNDYGLSANGARVKTLEAFLKDMNITILRNQSIIIGNQIRLVGVDDPHRGYDNMVKAFREVAKSDKLRIVLTHSPETVDFLLSRQPDLILTGHTHGGQVALPIFGPVFLNIKKGFKINAGLNYFNNIPVYLSKGIGTTLFPIRFNCRPELTLITLEH
ncbi:metallophosphoesterase [Candidatus Dependentiae bacterium]|nr:metallophosphoesterase [Candidatus Dependentiae bacterium]